MNKVTLFGGKDCEVKQAQDGRIILQIHYTGYSYREEEAREIINLKQLVVCSICNHGFIPTGTQTVKSK